MASIKDTSGLETKDTLQHYSDKHNGRLPTSGIPIEPKELKTPNKALKVFI